MKLTTRSEYALLATFSMLVDYGDVTAPDLIAVPK